MKHVPTLLILLAASALAQDATQAQAQPKKPDAQRLFVLKYADPQQLSNLLRVFDAQLTPNTSFHALAIRANPDAMSAIEEAIKRLDVPTAAPRDVDLTAQLVLGAEGADQAGGALPKDLESVVTQLRQAFPFKTYGLLDVLTLRSRTGGNGQTSTSSSGGAVAVNGQPQPVDSSLNINSISVEGDGATVRIDGFNLGTNVPYSTGNGTQAHRLNLRTDLDIKEGQKVVVGRLGINPSQALFVVLTAKIL
jgi:hypothetical protein